MLIIYGVVSLLFNFTNGHLFSYYSFLRFGFWFFLIQSLMLRTNYVAKDGLEFQNLFHPDPKDKLTIFLYLNSNDFIYLLMWPTKSEIIPVICTVQGLTHSSYKSPLVLLFFKLHALPLSHVWTALSLEMYLLERNRNGTTFSIIYQVDSLTAKL